MSKIDLSGGTCNKLSSGVLEGQMGQGYLDFGAGWLFSSHLEHITFNLLQRL